MNRLVAGIAFVVVVVTGTCPQQALALAIPFTTRAAFDLAFPGALHENWDTFAAGTIFVNGSTVNGITYNASGGNAIVENVFANTTPPNGLGETPNNFFLPSDTMKFSFGSPLSAFGIDINTFASTAGAYTATTDKGEVVGSFFDPFPGFGTGEFVGFSTTSPFTSVTIAATTGFSYTLDTMRFVRASAAVPAPTPLLLLGVGSASLIASRLLMHRRK